MKPAFFNIPDIKKEKVIAACIDEFGTYGYERSSTDRIISKAGISKGGLYEYISTKEELFLFIVEYVYRQLYDYLRDRAFQKDKDLPLDILERFKLISSIAIDFYIEHPDFIKFIANNYRQSDAELEERIRGIFLNQFMDVFGSVSAKNLKHKKGRLIDLLVWLLAKTRDEFLREYEKKPDVKSLKKVYNKNWDFYLSVLKDGIFISPE